MTFYQWLGLHLERPNRYQALAHRAVNEPSWPRYGGCAECRAHLSGVGAEQAELDLLAAAFRAYRAFERRNPDE